MARKKKSKQALLSKSSTTSHCSSVRIIAGQWRGRKLTFASDVQGLRPTPDRTRETLFNWLQDYIYEARCLDLFAGSGALGFEALSRGAAEVTFVEKHPRVARQLEVNSTLLKVKNKAIHVVQADAFAFLRQLMDKKIPAYDIIFLDPPFRQNIVPEILTLLEAQDILASSGMLYMEYEAEQEVQIADKVANDSCFIMHKQNKAGQVVSCLYRPS